MIKRSIIAGTTFAALAVVLGAFGAHGLEDALGPQNVHLLQSYETGVRYQFYHAFGLIVIGVLVKLFGETKLLRGAFLLFILGIIFFSGSIYMLATRSITGLEWTWLGPVTPMGGLCFIIGWILILINFIRSK